MGSLLLVGAYAPGAKGAFVKKTLGIYELAQFEPRIY